LFNETKIKTSVTGPCVDFEEEMKECNGWVLQTCFNTYKTDSIEEYNKTLSFARILGYIITDGHVSQKKYTICSSVFLGHMIDVTSFLEDLKQFCSIKQKKIGRASCRDRV